MSRDMLTKIAIDDANEEEICFRFLDEYIKKIVLREARKCKAPELREQALNFMDWIAMLDAGGGGNANTFRDRYVDNPVGGPIGRLVEFGENCGLLRRTNSRGFCFTSIVFRDHFAVRGGVAALSHSDPTIRDRAAWALWQVPNRVAYPALVAALSDGYKYARGSAISAIGAIGDRHALERLRPLTTDHTPVESICGTKISEIAEYWIARLLTPRTNG